MELLRKYGVSTTIYFPLIVKDSADFATGGDYTFAAGDIKISKDGGAAANTTNSPSSITMGNAAMWSLTLTATEMEAAQIAIVIADAATQAIEDQMVLISTYGNGSGQHAVDLDDGVRAGLTALPNAAANAAGGLPISTAGGLDMDALLDTPIKNTALNDIPVYLVSNADGRTPVTGATVTVERSLDGGAFVSATGTLAEVGNGLYMFDASAADMNGDSVVLKFTASGVDPYLINLSTTE